MQVSLAGKVVLITGGSRGIGAAAVEVFRSAGARVVFSYQQARERAEALAAKCGGDELCRAVQQDLRTPADGAELVRQAVAAFGRLDAVVVNHGVWPPHDQPIGTMSDAQWSSTLGINLDSVFGITRAAAAQMLAQDAVADTSLSWKTTPVRGHILFVASTAAQRGEAFHADYAASKGALISLTKSLSSELGPQGVLVNCVAPGWVRTEMSASTLADPELAPKALSYIPLGRPAEPEEIAGPLVFLCTPWAGFCSGEIFNVNGGAVLIG